MVLGVLKDSLVQCLDLFELALTRFAEGVIAALVFVSNLLNDALVFFDK